MLFPEMVQAQVVMTNSRGISAGTIAEHVIAVTLVLFRKFPLTFQSQLLESGAERRPRQPPIPTIAGTRALVIGLGSIGMASARLFTAFGARVTGIRRDPTSRSAQGVTDGAVERIAAPLDHAAPA